MERAGAAVVPALRVAVREAARDAAADPVVTPANTTVGRALNGSAAFRDALRLRIYHALQSRLAATTVRENEIRARGTLPRLENDTATVRRAVDRVSVERVGPNGTRLRVRVRNITLRAGRGGRTVTERSLSPTVTVDSPVLALHDRTERYERRLDARPTAPGSAGARFTLGTYLVASARGTAQWAGAPVANVLANRHVALATDAAVYDAQARTFGARDPEWVAGLGTTAARAVGQDAAAVAFEAGKQRGSNRQARALGLLQRFLLSDSTAATGTGRGETDRVTVAVGRSADAALAATLRQPSEGARNLTRDLREAYTVDARLAARTRLLETSRTGRRRPARAGDWQLAERERRVERRAGQLASSDARSAPVAEPSAGWHRLDAARRLVVERVTVFRHWTDGNRTTTTSRRTTRRYAVAVGLHGRHREPPAGVPQRPIRPVHESGGALDGPSLSGVAERATARLVTDRGGFGRLAERAVAGSLNRTRVPVRGQRPAGLDRWVQRDLLAFHEQVRTVSVRVPRRDLATMEATPATTLAAVLRQRRRALLDAPRVYAGAADRARLAARAAYLDRVVARLEERTERRQRARERLNDTLASRGLPGLSRIEQLHAAAENATTSGGSARPTRLGAVQFVPDATPGRLALTEVSRSEAGLRGGGIVRPLAAKNLNAFTLPFDDAASFVRGGGRETVPLGTAARVLRRARTANGSAADSDSLVDARAHLSETVVAGNDAIRERARTLLRREGIEGASRRQELVAQGLARWETPAARALAISNGSAAAAIAKTVAEAEDEVEAGANGSRSAARLEPLLRTEFVRALRGPAGQVPRRPVGRTDGLARNVADAALTEAVKVTAEHGRKAVEERLFSVSRQAVPAGLPVLPPVQPWYATINVWHVHVRGVHPSLVVRARGQGRTPPLAYERDGRPVRLDVDRDGAPERLGRSTRVAFDIETAVLVVVPPGGRGVGDTNGDADERTGWPTPAPWPPAQSSPGRK